MGKPGDEGRRHAVADTAGIVVEQNRRLGDRLGHGLEMQIKLVLIRL